jgi:hypothetical protein
VSGLARTLLFAGVLVLVCAGAALAGSALDPDLGRNEKPAHATGTDAKRATTSEAKHATGGERAPGAKGLAQAEGDVRLVIDDLGDVSASRELRFRIVDERGATVRDFDVEHDRRMHLIVVRRDLSGFQHVHPEQTADGAWKVPLRLDAAGSYRVFADFSSRGEAHMLGSDLQVDGSFEARELPHPAAAARTASGHEVRLEDAGGKMRFTVFERGRRIEDIEPYLGARGHLVALRQGDLAALHVHPESKATEGGDIQFTVEYPSPGRYRLFLQFKVDGRVHTAAFTRKVGDAGGH